MGVRLSPRALNRKKALVVERYTQSIQNRPPRAWGFESLSGHFWPRGPRVEAASLNLVQWRFESSRGYYDKMPAREREIDIRLVVAVGHAESGALHHRLVEHRDELAVFGEIDELIVPTDELALDEDLRNRRRAGISSKLRCQLRPRSDVVGFVWKLHLRTKPLRLLAIGAPVDDEKHNWGRSLHATIVPFC